MEEHPIRIPLDGGESVSAIRVSASTAAKDSWTVVYAPGAGSSINDPFGKALAAAFAVLGHEVIRFQFPYTEAKRRFPDRAPVLEATWRAALASAGVGRRVAIGGRSMGGRMASHVVAQGQQGIDALLLFAYPLHPPGQPDKPRSAHLPDVRVPSLFCSGTADVFGTPAELADAVALVQGARLHLLDGADHGFAPEKGSGRSRTTIYSEAIEAAASFLTGLEPRR